MSFLKAQWRKLLMANYAVEPQLLMPYLPHGCELDLWHGTCYVSLVGFMFQDTRLLGIKIPFHVNFEEVNLRFYVKCPDTSQKGAYKRGVVFIKEIVPKPALTWVANTLYKEHYQTLPMRHFWRETQEKKGDSPKPILEVGYEWKNQKAAQWQTFQAKALHTAQPLEVGSEAEFITEHYWDYTYLSATKTSEYEVRHPRWAVYPILSYHIAVDFGATYGQNFSFLTESEPKSVFLAEGSEISVEMFEKA
ncbi:YqjF family protein [Hugenholtzia roseola]|uniref:YqjF family protein n=1 Tax=Hugenholtzia roseola TaxID=1002 RepID=UPI00041C9554|nr:DUF2071 domain-containing protein [Hugenholtzia roseola]